MNKGAARSFKDMTLIQYLLDSWSHWKQMRKGVFWRLSYDVKELIGKTREVCLHCFFSGVSLVINGMCTCSLLLPLTRTLFKNFLVPSLYRNVDLFLSFIKLTLIFFYFLVIIEEIASENSDSIYSSTPEVKAWVSGICHK